MMMDHWSPRKKIKMKVLKTVIGLVLLFYVGSYILTAYNYVTRPSMFLAQVDGKEKYGDIKNNEDAVYNGIIRLKTQDNNFFCTGFVIDGRYAMTAAHCVVEMAAGEKIRIYDKNDTYTGTEAVVLGYNQRNDNAVIMGNFTNFKAVPIEKDIHGLIASKGPFMACGYPYGQKKLYCSYSYPISTENFSMKLVGALVPGMSGGPVFDVNTNKVVALNTAVENEFIIVNPIVGALGMYEIDQ